MDYTIDSTTDKLPSTGGIALVGKILEKTGFGHPQNCTKVKHPGILKSLVGLFVQGRTRFEEIQLFRADDVFQNSLELDYVPAAETLRLYLEQMVPDKEHVNSHVYQANLNLLRMVQLREEKVNGTNYLPVDIDTSPLDNSKSHKEGVSRTYKHFDGYHPIFGYIGMDGYMLGCQLREGKQHCQKGTPEFLQNIVESAKKVAKKKSLLFRLDGGNDSKDILTILMNSGHFFIVKRNLRKELPEYWLSVAKAEGTITYQMIEKQYIPDFIREERRQMILISQP